MGWTREAIRIGSTCVVILGLATGVTWAGKGGGKKPPPPDPDQTPPQVVTDLTITAVTPDSADMQWTAPYEDEDDPASGAVSSYDIRYLADVPVDETNWADALQAQGENNPPPGDPGTLETFTMHALLPGQMYYVAIRSIDDAGNVSGLSAAEMFTTATGDWAIEVAVSDGRPSISNVLAYDANDDPTIAYYDDSVGDVEFAFREQGIWQTERIDDGFHIDLAYDPTDDSATVAYTRSGDLRFGRRGPTGWTLETVDSGGVGGNDLGMAYDLSGNPAIAYGVWSNKQGGQRTLKLARWDGAAWQIETIVTNSVSIGFFADVEFDPSTGEPAVAFTGDQDDDGWLDTLHVARSTPSGWQIDLVETGSRGTGGDCDLAFAPMAPFDLTVAFRRDNRPDPEQVVVATRASDGTYALETVDEGNDCSLAFDAAGVAHMAYFTWIQYIKNGMNSKRVARREAGGWVIEEVARGFKTARTSIAFEPLTGEPAISCGDRDGLRYAVRSPVP